MNVRIASQEANLLDEIRAYRQELERRHRPITVRLYDYVLQDFDDFRAEWPGPGRIPGWPGLESEELVMAWVQSQCRRVGTRNVGSRLGCTGLSFLSSLGSNPS